MNNSELFFDGLKLMILGMGVVFSFLVVMIVLMNIMSKALAPFANFFAAPAAAKPIAKTAKADSELAAAAVTAVKMFRNK